MAEIAALQTLLRDVTKAAIDSLAGSTDRLGSGEREGQYALDLLVDGPLVYSLLEAGLGVLSEEAGILEPERELIAIVDPVDGSTNASRGIPWFATSICVVDDDGPLLAIVENHVTRERFEAVRGGGATRNDVALASPGKGSIADGVVGVNGAPPNDGPWAQFRTLGASALDISYVAMGALDAYVDFADEAHGIWDYAGAQLVCQELGAHIVDAFDRPLVHRSYGERRTPVVARDVETLELLLELRRRGS
ncbi:MAG: myo-inositol-1(or 4)-monophosphatase [Verrucomicrobiales bacterium]|jgi:myo-inositol-1(or 4)-monophosphatase